MEDPDQPGVTDPFKGLRLIREHAGSGSAEGTAVSVKANVIQDGIGSRTKDPTPEVPTWFASNPGPSFEMAEDFTDVRAAIRTSNRALAPREKGLDDGPNQVNNGGAEETTEAGRELERAPIRSFLRLRLLRYPDQKVFVGPERPLEPLIPECSGPMRLT